jgi:hypothetical protein
VASYFGADVVTVRSHVALTARSQWLKVTRWVTDRLGDGLTLGVTKVSEAWASSPLLAAAGAAASARGAASVIAPTVARPAIRRRR